RKTIRLGKCDRKSAEAIARHVEALLAAKIGGQPVPRDTAVWLTTVGAKLRDKFAAVGLIEPERRLTGGEYPEAWFAHKGAAGHSAASAVVWRQAIRDINDLFRDRPLAGLTHADGEALRNALLARGLRPTTIHKRLTLARQFLEDAVRLGHIAANPWKHVRHRAGDPGERRGYGPAAGVERGVQRCPHGCWKVPGAVARVG